MKMWVDRSGERDNTFLVFQEWVMSDINDLTFISIRMEHETTITDNELVETVKDLILGAKNSAMLPPFRIIVTAGTNLDASYFDGENDLGSLREELLRIEGVKEVKVGPDRGCAVESIGADEAARKGGA